jgi:hypothetical protein
MRRADEQRVGRQTLVRRHRLFQHSQRASLAPQEANVAGEAPLSSLMSSRLLEPPEMANDGAIAARYDAARRRAPPAVARQAKPACRVELGFDGGDRGIDDIGALAPKVRVVLPQPREHARWMPHVAVAARASACDVTLRMMPW